MDVLRQINKEMKDYKKEQAGKYLSPVRRIERVYPLKNERFCAMTFDDGPSQLTPNPNLQHIETGLTMHILETMKKFNAFGTFDVIGDTTDNYPDNRGRINTANWGGKAYDHYPDMGKDHLAGVQNQPTLVEQLLKNNQSLANHGYRHVIFGPRKLVYGRREYFKTLKEVCEDLLKLHNLVYTEHGFEMKLARPPHYIDRIPDGSSAYDAYAYLGYHYLAAYYDGGGWKATSGDYREDVNTMVRPMKQKLESDANFFNGMIIFQKDGYNMSKQTPVADALGRQLALLTQYQYKIISVEALMALSPFEDYGEGHAYFEIARQLDQLGLIIAYQNNTFQPDRILSFGELITMTTPRKLYSSRLWQLTKIKKEGSENALPIETIMQQSYPLRSTHPYILNFQYAKYMGYLEGISESLDVNDEATVEIVQQYLDNVAQTNNRKIPRLKKPKDAFMKRNEVLELLAAIYL